MGRKDTTGGLKGLVGKSASLGQSLKLNKLVFSRGRDAMHGKLVFFMAISFGHHDDMGG